MSQPVSPFIDIPRPAWAELAATTPEPLDPGVLEAARGLGDPTDQADVAEVFHPLTELISQYARNLGRVWQGWKAYLRLDVPQVPFVVAIAGSVAVGKSTVARLLTHLLSRSAGRPRVELVTTDAFLMPNAELEARGLLDKKGFPESYDAPALVRFVMDVKSGVPEADIPVYSHVIYDIEPLRRRRVSQPDILVLEGLNVLQPGRRRRGDGSPALSVSDFIDFSVYVDAEEAAVEQWFIERFLKLRDSAFRDPDSYFRQYALLPDDEAIAEAHAVWAGINGPNLRHNIAPTRERATVILHKNPDHAVETVRIRRI